MGFIFIILCFVFFALPSILRNKAGLSAVINFIFLIIFIHFILRDRHGFFEKGDIAMMLVVPWILGNFFKEACKKWYDKYFY